jgi:LmbE family N-acetylglucosaminyl deacetylase
MERILVAVAHPDDETLGCGASLARFTDEGRAIAIWFAADGVSSRQNQPQDASARAASAERALACLGVSDFEFGEFPDNALDTVSRLELAQSLQKLVDRFQPTCLITHSQSDLNIDHRLVGEVAAIVSRPVPGSPIKSRLCMEVPSGTAWFPEGPSMFRPTLFIDVSGSLDRKMAALHEYRVEIPAWPHARSIEAMAALANYRGATVGLPAAEAFEVALSLV